MFNNFSYRKFSLSGGPTNFTFSPQAPRCEWRQRSAWVATGATINQSQPDPGNDGIFFVGCKVTDLGGGMWHYEYARLNMNLDRAIQSFTVPLGPGGYISNVEFHAPPQHPGFAHDGTLREMPATTAPRGMLTPPTQTLSNGARKPLRLIRTPTRFATARFTISGSTPTKGRIIPLQR